MKTKNLTNLITGSAFVMILLISCNGCRSGRVVTGDKALSANTLDTGMVPSQTAPNQNGQISPTASPQETYQKPMVKISREFLGKQITLEVDPAHPGGEAWTTIWEEDVKDVRFERKNKICQLSPTVFLYRRFPAEVSKSFFYVDQPDKIEFTDTMFQTIKVVDIWKNRPYQNIQNAKLTFWHFDHEGMGTIPYSEQKSPIQADEYSLFTRVYAEGYHVVVNYELRSIKNIKNFGMEGYSSNVVGVKHTLHIYDLSGNFKYELKDLPSVDQAVVSNDGRYMMYIFGGMGLANANNPFGTIDRSGWALMRLKDQKVVFSEFTDDGILAFNRLCMQQNMPIVGYSTPQINDGVYDYFVFFDEHDESIYKKLWTHEEWKMLDKEWKSTGNKSWMYYIRKFNFEQIKIGEE
ncbi:MAG: hypothetical protein IPL63_16750 [Saprospiraceae bacterium]|nr:hypothetical protein [Saprospiraceae bacterium]MBK6564697.1 hypothetical protein [Saprospiraceae bacterium]MBK8079439.1 hypothetical protein [Saprospiraceae bacterium]MBK8371673.1 hypothetical protein [Saprospiraceae bacterium]MBK8548930.1 hypothetical protein [Saprospiraceae bacterium]